MLRSRLARCGAKLTLFSHAMPASCRPATLFAPLLTHSLPWLCPVSHLDGLADEPVTYLHHLTTHLSYIVQRSHTHTHTHRRRTAHPCQRHGSWPTAHGRCVVVCQESRTTIMALNAIGRHHWPFGSGFPPPLRPLLSPGSSMVPDSPLKKVGHRSHLCTWHHHRIPHHRLIHAQATGLGDPGFDQR